MRHPQMCGSSHNPSATALSCGDALETCWRNKDGVFTIQINNSQSWSFFTVEQHHITALCEVDMGGFLHGELGCHVDDGVLERCPTRHGLDGASRAYLRAVLVAEL